MSICIPVHNAGRWLGSCLESALAQQSDVCPVEVIAVNDHSSDDSEAILASFGARIRVYHSEKRGGNAARNLALAQARGAWVQYLDADDMLRPGKVLSQLLEIQLQQPRPDVAYAPVIVENWCNGQISHTSETFIDSKADLFEQWFNWQLPQTGGVLWRREALQQLGGWDEGMPCCQEHELYARALRQGLLFFRTQQAGAVYRIWSEGTVCRRDPLTLVEVKTSLIDAMTEYLKLQGEWKESHAQAAGRACFEMSRTLARFDLERASVYARDRQERGLWYMQGPAAPLHYRLATKLCGFRASERFARLRRNSI